MRQPLLTDQQAQFPIPYSLLRTLTTQNTTTLLNLESLRFFSHHSLNAYSEGSFSERIFALKNALLIRFSLSKSVSTFKNRPARIFVPQTFVKKNTNLRQPLLFFLPF